MIKDNQQYNPYAPPKSDVDPKNLQDINTWQDKNDLLVVSQNCEKLPLNCVECGRKIYSYNKKMRGTNRSWNSFFLMLLYALFFSFTPIPILAMGLGYKAVFIVRLIGIISVALVAYFLQTRITLQYGKCIKHKNKFPLLKWSGVAFMALIFIANLNIVRNSFKSGNFITRSIVIHAILMVILAWLTLTLAKYQELRIAKKQNDLIWIKGCNYAFLKKLPFLPK